jgi:hypothetical protein
MPALVNDSSEPVCVCVSRLCQEASERSGRENMSMRRASERIKSSKVTYLELTSMVGKIESERASERVNE